MQKSSVPAIDPVCSQESLSDSSSIKLSFDFSEDQIGTKSAKLVELDKLCNRLNTLALPIKVQVPELSPLTHTVIANHLDKNFPTWRDEWKNFVENQPKGSTTITSAANTILQRIRDNISIAFISRAFSAFETLKHFLESLPKSSLLMVRSTGKEDTVEIANPGGNESIPAVALEEKAITKAIGDVVVSYFSDKSLMQRLLSGDNITEPPFMPVLIQRMIGESFDLKSTKNKQIVKSGVMYAQKNGIRIQLAPGHGELVVNSKGTFDSYVVTNENVVYPEIYRKPNRLVPKLVSENGKMVTKLELHKNSKALSDSPSLSLSTALAIAKVGRHIYKHFAMPMDIEFVYDESSNTLSLVQARPIPKGDVKAVIPSAIAPDKLPDIKKHSEIQNAFIISPAGYATHVVTDKNQVIVTDTIEQALTQYLKPQANSPTKIVIVKEIAPATSHAAAQFNTKAIPVFAVDNLQSIQEWVSKSPLSIIADTQHKLLVKLANPATEKSLYDNETLRKGLFKSSLPSQLTLMPQIVVPNYKNALTNHTPNANTRSPLMIGDLIENIHSQNEKLSQESFYELTDALFNFLTTQWPAAQIPKNNIYTFLIKQIEFLESAKPQQKNSQEFIHALHVILTIFCRLAHKNKGNHALQMLLRQAMITAIEIKDQLKQFENMDDANINEAQVEYLNLISKLEALIVNPGNLKLFSNSLRQIAQEKKSFQLASKIKGFDVLSSSQKMYFVEFHKLAKLALNEKAATDWNHFAMRCCQSQDTTFQLAHLIAFNLKNKIASDWLNNGSIPKMPQANVGIILKAMHEDSAKVSSELKRLGIENTRTILEAWEQNISLWSDPKKFDNLWTEFNNEFLPLFDKHGISPGLTTTSQKIIFKTVQDLTEVFDKTIKAVKGSCEYNPVNQLKNFITLLEPYHRIMDKWVSYVPDSMFENWNKNIAVENSNSKQNILYHINYKFINISKYYDLDHLNPSGRFCVASAKIGSTAAFIRQFIEIDVTLEDMFTLFHQNILTSLALLSQNNINYSQLPDIIQPFLNEFRTLRTQQVLDSRLGAYDPGHPLELLSVTHEYPIVSLDYNLPLRNHAAKFIIEHDQRTQQTQLHAKFFGYNWHNRMFILRQLAYTEGLFLNVIEKNPVVYNDTANSIELTWLLTREQIQDPKFAALIKESLRFLSEYTFCPPLYNDELYAAFLKKYSSKQQLTGLKRYITSSKSGEIDDETRQLKRYLLPAAIHSGLPLNDCYTSQDIGEFLRSNSLDKLITKPYLPAKFNKFKETFKIDMPWSSLTILGHTLLEEIFLNGCTNVDLVEIIKSNNITLSDFPDIFHVILSKGNHQLLNLFEKHFIALSNQNLSFSILTMYYSKSAYKSHIEKAIRLCKGNIDISFANIESFFTLFKFSLPYASTRTKADLLCDALRGNNKKVLSEAIIETSCSETLSAIQPEHWDTLFSLYLNNFLKLMESPHFTISKNTLSLMDVNHILTLLTHKPQLINDSSEYIISTLHNRHCLAHITHIFEHKHFELAGVEGIEWQKSYYDKTLLEHLVEKLSLRNFSSIISLASFKLDDHKNLINLLAEKPDFLQAILCKKLSPVNQLISLENLYKIYSQKIFVKLCQELASNNPNLTETYFDDSQSYKRFIDFIVPHLPIAAQATLFTQAILNNQHATILSILAKQSKDEIVKHINIGTWPTLIANSKDCLLKYVDYTYLLELVGRSIDIDTNSYFCVLVLTTCLKDNLAIYPTLFQSALQKLLSSAYYREWLYSLLTVKMILSLIKLYSVDVDLKLRGAFYKNYLICDLLKSECDAQDLAELIQISKLNTASFSNILEAILILKNVKLLSALHANNIVLQHQTISLQLIFNYFHNKELVPTLVSFMQEPTRSIAISNFNVSMLTEEGGKLFYPLLNQNEKIALFSKCISAYEGVFPCQILLNLDSQLLIELPLSSDLQASLIKKFAIRTLLNYLNPLCQTSPKVNRDLFKKVFTEAIDSRIDLTNYVPNEILKDILSDFFPNKLTLDNLRFYKKQYDIQISLATLSQPNKESLIDSLVSSPNLYPHESLNEIFQLIDIKSIDLEIFCLLVSYALRNQNYEFLLALKQVVPLRHQRLFMTELLKHDYQNNYVINNLYIDILTSPNHLIEYEETLRPPMPFIVKYHLYLDGPFLANTFLNYIKAGDAISAKEYIELTSEKVLSHLSEDMWTLISNYHRFAFNNLIRSPHFKLDKIGLLAMAKASAAFLITFLDTKPNLTVLNSIASDIKRIAKESYSLDQMERLVEALPENYFANQERLAYRSRSLALFFSPCTTVSCHSDSEPHCLYNGMEYY